MLCIKKNNQHEPVKNNLKIVKSRFSLWSSFKKTEPD